MSTHRQALCRGVEGVKHPPDPGTLRPPDVPEEAGLQGVGGQLVVPDDRHGAHGILGEV